MPSDHCRLLKDDEVLNASHIEWPLFKVTIHGSRVERMKLSKRLSCALKHLPLRLAIVYERDTERSIEAGVAKDPTLVWNGTLLSEGLVSAEVLTRIFASLLHQ